MNNIFSKFGNVEVVFSNHSKQRLVQRFKLFLTKYEKRDPEIFLKRDFKTAKVNMSDHMSPGRVNARDSKYGKDSFVAMSETMCYYGNYIESTNKILVKTIYPVK